MKKNLFLIVTLVFCMSAAAQTQRVLKGAVIDKNENPLPGAKVSTQNGTHVTIVKDDGSFSMEVPIWTKRLIAQYSGMKNKKLKVDSCEMIFRLFPKDKGKWFICGDYSIIFEHSGHAISLMGGYLSKWGGYAKATLGSTNLGPGVFQNYTVGITKRIIEPLHVFVGVGIQNISNQNFCLELGMIGKIGNHVLVNGGFQIRKPNILFLGAGYAF